MKYLPTVIKDVEYSIASVKVENCETTVENVLKNNLRSRIVNVITNFYKKNKPNEKHQIIRKNLLYTQRFLKDRQDLIVARSDKGNNTVIMWKEEYEKEMFNLINDKKNLQKNR